MFRFDLHKFDANSVVHATTGYTNANTGVVTAYTPTQGLSAEMKTYYDKNLIRYADPVLVHDQFGQKRSIPKNGGKKIEFRKFDRLPAATTPLQEGVTPDGHPMNNTAIEAEVQQFGDFIALTDVIQLTAIDRLLVEATQLLGSQAGETLDSITREVLAQGTNVQYGTNTKVARNLLVGGDSTEANNDYLTVNAIRLSARALKRQNAPKMSDGNYVAIVHPDVAFDLQNDPKWENVKTYSDPADWYKGEIGRIGGVRFVETSEAKIFHAENLAGETRNLAVNNASGYSGKITSIAFDGATVEADALKGRKILLNGVVATVTGNTASAITVESTDFGTVTDDMVIYPGEAGAGGRDVYATLVLADKAYGVTEIEGGGLEFIIKQLGSAGSADPLNQRSTAGWKALKTAVILVDEYMVRIETTASFA